PTQTEDSRIQRRADRRVPAPQSGCSVPARCGTKVPLGRWACKQAADITAVTDQPKASRKAAAEGSVRRRLPRWPAGSTCEPSDEAAREGADLLSRKRAGCTRARIPEIVPPTPR